MNCLIAVLPSRKAIDAAYTALKKANLPLDGITRVGSGLTAAEEVELLNPKLKARRVRKLMALWLLPFGFLGGLTFSFMTNLDTFAWAGPVGSRIVAGLAGSVSGLMGSFVISTNLANSSSNGDLLPFLNRLDEGKFLLLVEGDNRLAEQAAAVLRPLRPESIQFYGEAS
jgi:hypothetical protein